MEDSILNSIKKLLGIDEYYTQFDADIIMHINSVFMILTQIGAGPENGFSIVDKTNTWKEFIQNENAIEDVKSYMYLKVRMLFDPPTSTAVMDAMNRSINELEWRIQVAVDR